MRYRMSVIYGHPVIAETRALRFADHVTKRNGGSGDENGLKMDFISRRSSISALHCDKCRPYPLSALISIRRPG